MKSYQIKVILKNSRPPVWRRCLIPAGITFAQLALILQKIVETRWTPNYEYEFYRSGVRVHEWMEEETHLTTYYYGYMCASDTFIDTLVEQDTWFTFRPGDRSQYRVEIEKRLPDKCSWPSVIKQKDSTEFREWSTMNDVNEKLKKYFPITYGAADYRSYEDLRRELIRWKYGFTGTENPINRTGRQKKSSESILQEIADSIMQLHKKKKEEEKSRQPDIKEFLLGTTKKELLEIADDLGLSCYKSLNKSELSEKIRDEILKPDVMARRMLLLSDSEIQAFEQALSKENGFFPGFSEMEKLEKLYDLMYVMFYCDDYVEVPREAARVYELINTPEYQEKRRGTYWTYHCLLMTEMIYICAPVNVVCKMLEKCLKHKVGRNEFEEFFFNIPREVQRYVLKHNRIIPEEVFRDDLYLDIEKAQGKKEFYIPEAEEVWEYTENGYPVSDPYYCRLKQFLIRELEIDSDDMESLMAMIWNKISMGESLSDIMEIFDEEEMTFRTEESVKEFVSIMADVNNHTRMPINRGWTPDEMIKRMPRQLHEGQRTKIVPMSSNAAEILESEAERLKEMGLDIDLESNADEITTVSMPEGPGGKTVLGKKKIYPNDPCPCGSGKKYKKCCGRKSKP